MAKNADRELAALGRGIQHCEHCPLHESRTHAVPGEGNSHARVVLIGEAPGATEDAQGRPFVGRAGRFLDMLLGRNGLQRATLFITNSVKCRPPDNRFPRVHELETCKAHWLDRQLALIDPQIIVLLGRAPLTQVLGERDSLKRLHGQVRQHAGRSYQIQYHPAAGLRSSDVRSFMQHDFAALQELVRQQK